RLSPAEYEEKKRKGLCFKCDEKYFVGHNCMNKELRVMLVVNGCEIELNEDGEESMAGEELEEEQKEFMELSLQSFLGISSPTTTKVRGLIGRTEIIIMLDSGATHNFISPDVVKKTKLRPQKNNSYEISLGTGITVQSLGSLGVCKAVKFLMQEWEFQADFISLELGNADIILGIQWLRTLGKCQVDWETHEISFIHKGGMITIHGDHSLHTPQRSSKAVLQNMEESDESNSMMEWKKHEVLQGIHPHIEVLLEEFGGVFAEPTGLPPLRGREHAIHLVKGANPISVRPYRYPHIHKEEMEKQVKNMLDSGIIRPSHSPFSSPVLLVKKKDNSWRFCVDYRALNRVTVMDKFPIPVIDQLLDELHGAKIFSKLDLRAG
ncbi:hypothetical protein AALP_AAs58075U000100, partial [Arabis alpina]